MDRGPRSRRGPLWERKVVSGMLLENAKFFSEIGLIKIT